MGTERDDRGWDGWMASPTWWTWVWVSSGSWWWTGKPGMLKPMGSHRVGHDWVTALNSSDNPASANYVVICGRCCAQASTQIAPFTFKLTLRCRHCWLSYIISVFQMERSSTHESSKFPETQIYWKVGPGFAPAFLILGHWWKHSSSRLVWFIYYGQDKKHWPMEDTARQMHAE